MAIPKTTPLQAEIAAVDAAAPRALAARSTAKKAKHRRRRHRHHGTWNDKHYRWVPADNGDWRVESYVFHHKQKPPKHHYRGPGPKPPLRATGAPAPAAAPVAAPPPPASVPPGTFAGSFGIPQATRLLERAGFGPIPGQAEALVALGVVDAVRSLTRPTGSAALAGPAPTDGDGNPLSPATQWGHAHLAWLDRMVRSDQPLVERMTLVFHDWFATSEANVNKPQLMMDQANIFRAGCFGSFLDLFEAVTVDPAMLLWLNGAENVKGAPNENYAREMMELFSLGADRGAYTEDDIREQARALTGWDYDWSSEEGPHDFRFVAGRHDTGRKTVFGRSGNWGWEDACRLCVENPLHPSYFVQKLWSYFIPAPPSTERREELAAIYAGSGWGIRPVLEAILVSPELYEGPPMVKPPVVHLASMLRGVGRFIDTEDWSWLCDQAGQLLYWPPSVAGWDDNRWLDTSTLRARWNTVDSVLDGIKIEEWDTEYPETETADEALARALSTWGEPELRPEHRAELLDFGRRCEARMTAKWMRSPYRAYRQNALLQLIGVSPDVVLQ